MLRGTRKYWLIAVLCGLTASLLTFQYLQDVKNRYRPDDLVPVIVAKENINENTIITKEQLKIEEIPAKYTHPDVIKDMDEIIGKTATTKVAKGEAFLKQKLLSADKASRLSYAIPQSKRAVSIPIDNVSGVAGYINAGDKVDIVATLDIPVPDTQSGEKNTAFSVLTLQNIEVLAVGDNPNSQTKNSGGATLTLAVAVQEAPSLILASERGSIRLLLRSPVDNSQTTVPPYQLKDYLNSGI